MAIVLNTKINAERGIPPVSVNGIQMIAGKGIVGDWHQGMGKRDVCILRKEMLDWMKAQPVQGICFARYKENLLIEGFRDGQITPGTRMQFENVVLEVSDFPKQCFPESCAFAQSCGYCKLRQEYQMAKILTSGVIYPGERVELVEDSGAMPER